MGCHNCISKTNDFVIMNTIEDISEPISELKLIDKIIEKRHTLLKLKPISSLEKEPSKDKTRNDFIEDTNNEEKLCQYLDELKNSNIEEYELILFLYFDVLSPENKKIYTNENFQSNIDKFREMIEILKNKEFQNENYSKYLDNRIILIEKGIIKRFHNLTDLIGKTKKIKNNQFKDMFQEETNNKLIIKLKEQIQNEIDNILNKRIKSKISLSNIEIFFQELIKIYIETFSKKKGIKLKMVQTNVITIYETINDSIDKIKKNKNKFYKYSSEEEKYYLLVFLAPIISSDLNEFYNFSQRNLDIKGEHFEFINNDNKLIVKYKGNNNSILKFPEYNAIDQNIIINKFSQYFKLNLDINDYSIIHCVKPNYFQKYNYYTYKKENWEFNINLLKYILKSKTIKSLIDHLMPELKKVNVFNDDKTLKEIMDSLVFVPYKLDEGYGVTLKSFLKIFINGLPPAFPEREILLNDSSSFQIIGIHESIGNWICGYLSYKLNNNSLFKSICYNNYEVEGFDNEIKQFDLQKLDGGEIIEKILFSRVMEYTIIKEMLFIICKNSYNDDYLIFKTKFQEVRKKDIKNIYDEVTKDPDLKKYLDFIEVNIEYLANLENSEFNLKFKRNGDKKNTCATRYINV